MFRQSKNSEQESDHSPSTQSTSMFSYISSRHFKMHTSVFSPRLNNNYEVILIQYLSISPHFTKEIKMIFKTGSLLIDYDFQYVGKIQLSITAVFV